MNDAVRNADADAEARELADFLAGQAPVQVAAAGWMVRRQDGLSPEEDAELQDWLAADPGHQAALDELEDLWGRLDEIPPEGVDTLKAGLSPGGEGRVPAGPSAVVPQPAGGGGCAPPAPPESAGRRAWLLGLPRFAPAALAVTGLAGGWLGWAAWQRWPRHEQHFSTARGATREVVLPDGSTLWLDTATRAEVAYYRGGREVRLSGGQVMFDVRADAGRPFHVLAGELRITVIGTRFSVRHAAGGMFGQGVYVSVEEGRVAVVRSGGPATLFQPVEALELGAGQAVAADAQGHLGAAARAPDGEPAAWRHGRIDFVDATLGQALAEFERYGPVSLVVRDPAVAALRVHGSFAWREQDAFARALPRVLPVRLRRLSDGRMEIVGKGRE